MSLVLRNPDQRQTGRWAVLLFFLLVFRVSFAQTPITGSVTDAATGDALAGTTIQVKGTNVGATTDANGRYQLGAGAGLSQPARRELRPGAGG